MSMSMFYWTVDAIMTRGAEVLVDHQPGQQPFLACVASGHQLCLGLRGFGDAPTSGAPGDSRLGVQLSQKCGISLG